MAKNSINAFFTKKNSVYNSIKGVNTYDIERNALTCADTLLGIYHPPCRSWGQLKHLAKPRVGERKLAIWAMFRVLRFGGVLEHPANSELFNFLADQYELFDKFGVAINTGFILNINQVDFGHECKKPTKLLICGLGRSKLPTMPPTGKKPTKTIAAFRGKNKNERNYKLKQLSSAKREDTPLDLALFLVEICRRIKAQ